MKFSVLQRAAAVAAILVFGSVMADGARAQQVAGSVESGLQNLAQDIVTKSAAQDHLRIAVLPFPNADGSCSVLSTYLADELIEALGATPGNTLSIVERTQLEAIINEMQINAAGILNPETTKSIGQISGVKALMLGTITQIGDRVRINARLVGTDTGILIASAAVSVPRTGDVDSLFRQPVPGEGGTCGVRIVSRSQTAQAGTTLSPAAGAPVMNGANSQGGQVIRSTTLDDLAITAQTVVRSADKKAVTVIVTVTNKKPEPVQIIMTAPKPSIIDDATNSIEAASVNGIGICNNFQWDTHWCANQYQALAFTTLTQDVPVTILFKFQAKDEVLNGRSLSFAATVLKMPRKLDENFNKAVSSADVLSISFSNVPISEAAAR